MERRYFLRILTGGLIVAASSALTACDPYGRYGRWGDWYDRDYLDDYYYYPDHDVYYHIRTGDYYYLDRGVWRRSRRPPRHVRLDRRRRQRLHTRPPWKDRDGRRRDRDRRDRDRRDRDRHDHDRDRDRDRDRHGDRDRDDDRVRRVPERGEPHWTRRPDADGARGREPDRSGSHPTRREDADGDDRRERRIWPPEEDDHDTGRRRR